ncbi:MAG TPA: hypothetical protein VKR26_13540, partial [Terriglobales bacterium]|nr:hypothetical protein [Terriglobales bacterium]
MCIPMWGQEPAGPPGTITAKAAPPPPLNGPAPAEVTSVPTDHASRRLKPEDNVDLIGRRNVGGGVNFYSLRKE